MIPNSAETWDFRVSGIKKNEKTWWIMIYVGIEQEMGALIAGNEKTCFKNSKFYAIKGLRLRIY